MSCAVRPRSNRSGHRLGCSFLPAKVGKESCVCPYPYFTVMRESKDSRYLRLRMVQHAKAHGIKPAARIFCTTPKTIRKWLERCDGTLGSLAQRSRTASSQSPEAPFGPGAQDRRSKEAASPLVGQTAQAGLQAAIRREDHSPRLPRSQPQSQVPPQEASDQAMPPRGRCGRQCFQPAE